MGLKITPVAPDLHHGLTSVPDADFETLPL